MAICLDQHYCYIFDDLRNIILDSKHDLLYNMIVMNLADIFTGTHGIKIYIAETAFITLYMLIGLAVLPRHDFISFY